MGEAVDETVRAYDLDAAAYAANRPVVPDAVRADIAVLFGLVGRGAQVRPRYFTYWRANDLSTVVAALGWSEVSVRSGVAGSRGETWLELSAARDGVSP